MGIAVMVLGESGSGKSASMRNFKPNEIGVINVAGKPLPFKEGKDFKTVKTDKYATIRSVLVKNTLKRYVIDDAQYLMSFFLMSKVNEMGYGKFTQCAKDFYDLVQCAINETSDDTIVYFLMHTERDDMGHIKAKTAGKMLDNQITLEGLFSIVLMAQTDGKKHVFITQSDGMTTAKSPMEMFAGYEIDNDLKVVDDTIRAYYGLNNSEKEKESK